MTPNCFLRPLLFSFLLLTAAGGSVFAQSTSAGEERQAIAHRYVHDVLPYWQHRLQLDDWTIHLMLTRKEDLRPGTLGNIHWDREAKSATIHVMDSTGYGDSGLAPMLKDMQVTVVHELVHLELASLPVAEADRSTQEFAIDHLTDALLAASEGSPANEYLTAAASPARNR